ncbi:MAG: DUF1674 domain-containing protein [Panacagrimonas sp.]
MKPTDDKAVRRFDPSQNAATKLKDLPPTPAAPVGGAASGPVKDGIEEIGGRRNGLDPTRYGDWEKDGRCIDF